MKKSLRCTYSKGRKIILRHPASPYWTRRKNAQQKILVKKQLHIYVCKNRCPHSEIIKENPAIVEKSASSKSFQLHCSQMGLVHSVSICLWAIGGLGISPVPHLTITFPWSTGCIPVAGITGGANLPKKVVTSLLSSKSPRERGSHPSKANHCAGTKQPSLQDALCIPRSYIFKDVH